MFGSAVGGNDKLEATGNGNVLFGDGADMGFASPEDKPRGGNDVLSASGDANVLAGDGTAMAEASRGGNDVLSVSGNGNALFGDAGRTYVVISDEGDVLGTVRFEDELFPDDTPSIFFGGMSGNAVGGNDALSATGDGNALHGDARFMTDAARGGNDVLTVISESGQSNQLYGDAYIMSGNAAGGNDTLIGAAGNDLIVGDALVMLGNAKGGNDQLWGDAKGAASGGADTFAFAGAFGKDVVNDFRQSDGAGDMIRLNGYGDALTIDDVLDNVSVIGKNTVIDIGAALDGPAKVNTITLAKFTDPLTADDFIFTDVS